MTGNDYLPVKLGEMKYQGHTYDIFRTVYQTNKALCVCVQRRDEGHPTVISENHDGAMLKSNQVVVQTRNFSKDLREALLASGLFKETKNTHMFGLFNTIEPIWELTRWGS